MIAQVRMQRRRYRVCGRIDKKGVAVGVRLGDEIGSDGRSPTRAVLHNNRLPELRRQLLEHQTRDDVDEGARRERHDRLQRLRRPSLCLGLECRESENDSRYQHQAERFHDILLYVIACAVAVAHRDVGGRIPSSSGH